MFRSANGASVKRISSAPRRGPAASATAVPTPTRVATRSHRPRTSSPLRRRASIARRPSTSTTCAASAQRTPIQTATGIPIPVAVRVIHAAARIPDAPSSGRHRMIASRYASTGLTSRPSSRRTSAQTVAAWTSARPSSVSVVPIRTDSSTSAPAPSASPPTPATSSPWSSVVTRTIGISSRPIPRKSSARPTYIRVAAERIWPHVRRRAIRSGATGVHVALTVRKITNPRRRASATTIGRGFCRSLISPTEPAATASQKKSVALVPKTPPVGTP